ncbi:hypothetical protein ACNFIC_09215 [Pseudomonas sp. NY15463]|uniref:hypothetical protein n=1 Tax=Pseudomonas sp. NY15463 TaxID=3400361 RepID=UPI003A89FFD9
MDDQHAYPTPRVLLAFIAAPSLTGLLLVLAELVHSLMGASALTNALGYFGLAVVMMIGALMFYGIPAVLVGLTCVVLRLQRTWRAGSLVVSLAALLSQGWAEFMASQTISGELFLTLPGLGRLTSAALGAGASLVVVWWVLPKPRSEGLGG